MGRKMVPRVKDNNPWAAGNVPHWISMKSRLVRVQNFKTDHFI